MKASYRWIKDYVSIQDKPEALAKKLTMAGMEVEAMSREGKDVVYELEITPNRADCLNIIGLSREVSALSNKPLKIPHIPALKKTSRRCNITIEDKKGCPRYIGAIIEGVKVGATQEAIRLRIESIGMRSINNIVDITNFCLMEMGQPLHAFDFDRLEGGKIVVRRAKEGEKIVTLDGEERTLDPSILVIADAKKPVAIAGIMGGAETEVGPNTKNILLESAFFDPLLIRQAARKHGIMTESSYRFERKVDIAGVERTALRAVDLIQKMAGGSIVAFSDFFPAKKTLQRPKSVFLSQEGVERLLGAKVSLAKSQMILKRLGFQVKARNKKSLKVTPPSFRSDIAIPEDLIEEIARIIGYENISEKLPHLTYGQPIQEEQTLLKQKIREALIGEGVSEVVTYTLCSRREEESVSGKKKEPIPIRNPLTQDQAVLRSQILSSLLNVVKRNIRNGEKNLRLFEIGRVYSASDGEKEVVACIMTGRKEIDWREGRAPVLLDFFDLKGVIEETLQKIFYSEDLDFQEEESPLFEDGRRAAVCYQRQKIGVLGEVRQEILEKWNISERVFFAELDFELIRDLPKQHPLFKKLPIFPSVSRDISLSLEETIPFSEVKRVIIQQGTDLLQSVTLLEEYRGEKIPEGRKGLTVSLLFRSDERTLQETEVEAIHNKICEALDNELGALRR